MLSSGLTNDQAKPFPNIGEKNPPPRRSVLPKSVTTSNRQVHDIQPFQVRSSLAAKSYQLISASQHLELI